MKLSRLYTRLLFGIFIPGLFSLNVKAQQNNSMYYMQSLPQAVQLNPAIQPKCGFFIGFPSFEVNGGNSAVGLNDIFVNDPKNNRMFWFLKDASSRANFLNKWKDDESVYGDLRVDYLSLGFRISNSYFTFNITDHMESRNYIPYGLADLLVNGNLASFGGQKKTVDLSNMGMNATYYHEYGVGFSHVFSDKLTLGIRAKALFGVGNITTNSSDVKLQDGGIDSYITRSKISLNTSIPNLRVVKKADGNVDTLDFKEIDNAKEARKILMNTRNMGFALDFGGVYKLNEKFSVSASLIDLGFIRWKDNLNNFEQDAAYDFRGVEFNPNDTSDVGKAILDTLKNKFTYTSSSDAYSTWLQPKLYAGVFFKPIKLIGLGFLTRQQIINKNLFSQYTFSVNLYPANAFNLTLSYTIADHMYDNFGCGVAFKLLPFQVYLLCERIPLYWDKNKEGFPYIPAYAKNVNFKAGINLAFGYNHKEKKAKKDKPLVEP